MGHLINIYGISVQNFMLPGLVKYIAVTLYTKY